MTDRGVALYLDLIEKCLLNTIYEDPAQDPWSAPEFDADKRAGVSTGRPSRTR